VDSEIYVDAKVHALRQLHAETLQLDRTQFSIQTLLARQAQSILDGHTEGNDAVTFHLACWCPQVIGQPPQQIMNTPLSLGLARQTIALEYGYEDWAAVEALGEQKLDENFEQAVDAVMTGNLKTLQALLKEKPSLATQTSQYPHAATLLHYLAANGVESHRQITPLNAAEIAKCLIDAGADVNVPANMYGGGSSVLGLLLSSAHPANAGVCDDVAHVLRNAGAKQ